MGNNTWDNLLDPTAVARHAAQNTFTGILDITPTPLPATYANELKLGSRICVEAWGEYSSLTGATLGLGVWYGAVAQVWAMAQFTLGTTPTAWPWRLRWTGLVTAVGATGTIDGMGEAKIGSSLTAFNVEQALPATAAARIVTVDTTILKNWGVSANYGASSASNSITCYCCNVSILNQGST